MVHLPLARRARLGHRRARDRHAPAAALILGIVQFALWEHATHVAQAVAEQGSRRRPGPRRHRPGRHLRGTKRPGPARLRRPGAPECERHPRRRHHDGRRHRTGRSDPALLEPAGSLGGDRAVRTVHDKRPGTMRRGPSTPGQRAGSATVELVILTPLLILLLLVRRRPRPPGRGAHRRRRRRRRRPHGLRRSPAVRKPPRRRANRSRPRHSVPSTSPVRTWPSRSTPPTSPPAARWP